MSLRDTRHSLRRFFGLLLAVAISAVAFAGSAQPSAWAARSLQPAIADSCANNIVYIYYFNNAQHTTEVGECYHSCCTTWTCTGEVTNYYNLREFSCD